MGVPGLWNLLEPARRPVDLEALTGKVIAVDMNIWLHQAVKSRLALTGTRGFLAILFRRLCKLIYFGIRPVFVFDGEVPLLKKSTMAARRRLRSKLGTRAEKAQHLMFRRLLRRVAEAAVVPNVKESADDTELRPLSRVSKAKDQLLKRLAQLPEVQQANEDAELFSAPIEQTDSQLDSNGLLMEDAGMEYDALARDFLDGYNLYVRDQSNGPQLPLDLNSPALLALPLAAQLRVIQLARDQLDSEFRSNQAAGSQFREALVTETFSNNQVTRLLLRRRLVERQQELSEQIAKEDATRQFALLNNPKLTATLNSQLELIREVSGTGDVGVFTNALRIQSQDSGHALLIKRSPIKSLAGPSGSKADMLGLCLENLIIPPSALASSDEHPISQPSDFVSPSRNTVELCLQDESSASQSSSDSFSSDQEDEKGTLTSPTDNLLLQRLTAETTPGVQSNNDGATKQETDSTSIPSLSPNKHSKEFVEVPHAPLEDVRHDPSTDEERSDQDFIDVPDEQEMIESVSLVSAPVAVDNTTANLTIVPTTSDLPSDDGHVVTAPVQLKNEVHVPEYWMTAGTDEAVVQLSDTALQEQADRLTRQAQTTTTRCIEEAQELLRLFGVPFVVSPEEAEAQCASLQRSGLADLVASDDSDVWPFGARIVCRHLFGSASRKPDRKHQPPPASVYRLEEVRRSVGLDVANILRLTLLCGSDYTPGVQNVGPVTALEILSEFGDLADMDDSTWAAWLDGGDTRASDYLVDRVLDPLKQFASWWKTIHTNPDTKLLDMKGVRKKWAGLTLPTGFPDRRIVEAYLRPNVTTVKQTFSWDEPNTSQLTKHAVSVLGWRPDQTEAMLRTVLNRHQQRCLGSLSSSTRITAYFPAVPSSCAEELNPDSTSVPSKRTRTALVRLKQNRIQNRKEDNPEDSQATAGHTDDPLAQLPSRRPRRGRTKQEIQSKRKRTTGLKQPSKRRVVERVALSDLDDDDDDN